MQKLNSECYNKKKYLIKNIRKNKYNLLNRILIIDLIESGCIDKYIKKISKDKVILIKSPIIRKGYLTGYEQFISILDNFIIYFLNIIDSPEQTKTIILNCLQNSDILLSKKNIYDNENINYYIHNYNYIITYTFYKNLLKLKNELKEELLYINININKINIKDEKDLLYLTDILSEIVFINRNDYKIVSLFNEIEEEKISLYLDWYKMLLLKYIHNIDFIYKYREFKKNNQ